MKRSFATPVILLLIIIISNGIGQPIYAEKGTAIFEKIESDQNDLIIQDVRLKVQYKNRFVLLEELIQEGQTAEEARTFPQIENGSTIHVNATYSTVIGKSNSIVIREFSVMVFEVTNESFSTEVGVSRYNYNNPEELVLKPNSSKSEFININSLKLPIYTNYKFVFRVQYHIYRGNEAPQDSYYNQNMTFELIKSYPTPPYFLIYAFYAISIIFIALIAVGLYGDRKYKITS